MLCCLRKNRRDLLNNTEYFEFRCKIQLTTLTASTRTSTRRRRRDSGRPRGSRGRRRTRPEDSSRGLSSLAKLLREGHSQPHQGQPRPPHRPEGRNLPRRRRDLHLRLLDGPNPIRPLQLRDQQHLRLEGPNLPPPHQGGHNLQLPPHGRQPLHQEDHSLRPKRQGLLVAQPQEGHKKNCLAMKSQQATTTEGRNQRHQRRAELNQPPGRQPRRPGDHSLRPQRQGPLLAQHQEDHKANCLAMKSRQVTTTEGHNQRHQRRAKLKQRPGRQPRRLEDHSLRPQRQGPLLALPLEGPIRLQEGQIRLREGPFSNRKSMRTATRTRSRPRNFN